MPANWEGCHKRAVRWILLMVLLGGLISSPYLGFASSEAAVRIGPFSQAQQGDGVPDGWTPLVFPKIPNQTQYAIVKEQGTTVIRAMSHSAASGLTHPVRIDLKEYPIIHWRWKVLNVIKNSNVYRKEGDDYAARIYITFAYEPDRVGIIKKAKYMAGRLALGDIPIAAINYIWESKTPRETIVDNAYTNFVKMIVVESGEEKVGQWVQEDRNLYEDYKKAFGEEPSLVSGIAIMTDTDNTGGEATAFYGDIVFKKSQ